MTSRSEIVQVTARQVHSDRGHPGVEAVVRTANGTEGVAVCTAGTSVGAHEVEFAYDGGERWGGRGVTAAARSVNQVIAQAIRGMDASRQREVDEAILALAQRLPEGLGGNAVGAVSAAVLKAGAASLGIPLYQHIGGVNACVLPTPGVLVSWGARRYGGADKSGTKPTYSMICHGFSSFSEASYAAWDVSTEFTRLCRQRYGLDERRYCAVYFPRGVVQHDREIWALMAEAIDRLGYDGQIGLQVDIAAGTYFRAADGLYAGLFSDGPKTREDLARLYEEMTTDFPFLILEDPLDEDDYEGHASLTRSLNVEIVGDDLFTTNSERLLQGIGAGAATTMLLKVYQIGTISQAFDAVRLAYRHGYGVMPCDSRGEGSDIADYSVGLSTGHLREGAIGPTGNRFLAIEAELGTRAVFAGRSGLRR
jgi:enolase